MSYSVTNLKADLTGQMHGTTLNSIQNLDGMIYRAARTLLADCDPAETKRIQLMTTPIYNQVYDYAIPTDLKGNRIIDIYPSGKRQINDIIGQTYNQNFDRNKDSNRSPSTFTILHNTGVKYIRINDITLSSGITLDTADSIDGWTETGTATTPAIDNVNFASGYSSLKFNLAAGANPSTGGVTKTLSAPLDMTSHLNQSSLFFWVYLPTASQMTSVTLKWGSDNSNYYSRVLTANSFGNAFENGWNLLQADWLGCTVTGTPTVTAIDYVAVDYTYTGNLQTAVRLDNIVSNLGEMMKIEYYSKYLFRDSSTGAFQESITDDSNIINLDTDSYNLLVNLVAFYAVQQQQGANALAFDSNFFGQEYVKSLKRYTSLYKSEVDKPKLPYYKVSKAGYSQYLGRKLY